jgi:hypothetical protein
VRFPDRAFSACASDVNNYSIGCVTSLNTGFRSKVPLLSAYAWRKSIDFLALRPMLAYPVILHRLGHIP